MKARLTYANVVSTVALFGVIAGGTAVALPGKGSVQANDLKKNAVKAAAIAAKAVRSAEVKDGSLRSEDVADLGLRYEDLGSNSVVARIRSSGPPLSSGDGGEANPVTVPLTGNSWTQAANEIEVGFGEGSYTEPAACGNNGSLAVEMVIDGVLTDNDFFNDADPGTTGTEPFLRSRPYLFEPGTATPHTAAIRIWDTCMNAGENYTLNEIKADIVGIR